MNRLFNLLLTATALAGLPLQAGLLVPTNSPNWRFKTGLTEASSPITAWRGSNFIDTAFVTRPAPFWYGDVRDGGTQITDMLNSYGCIFLRHQFVVTNLAEVSGLQVSAYIDDGFVMWINGVEVQRVAVTDPLDIGATAAGRVVNQAVDPAVFNDYLLPTPASGYLVNGTNYLCVQVFNTTLASSDLGFDCQLVSFAPDLVAPSVVSKTPAPGVVNDLTSITVDFGESVVGVDAADLLINGVPAATVSSTGGVYTFGFARPIEGSVSISWSATANILDFGNPPNNFDPAAPANSWQYTLVDAAPPVMSRILPLTNSTVRSLTSIEILFNEPVANVDASDLLINGTPASDVTFGDPGQFFFSFPQPPTGAVQVAWASGHGIKDLATVPNNFAGGAWTYVLDPNVAFFDIRINEFMADNANGIRDEDGTRQDWIELYNASSTAVDLTGWYLTDNASDLKQWRFPAVAMPANGYLLVWASGKNRTNNIAALHSNFSLRKEGEYLGLVLPDGTNVISSFAPFYLEQQTDVSYGRDRLDPSLVGYYATPTPRGPNSIGGPGGFASDVVYSRKSSTFVAPFALTLSTADTNAVIRYVLITNAAQGSASITNVPSTNSPIYTNPIPVSVTTEVRARAFAPGLFPSTPITQSYVQISPNVVNFSSDLPICIVHVLGADPIPATWISGIMMSFDNEYDRASLTNSPQLATRAGFHRRGSSTLDQAKSNLAIEFWDEFNQDEAHPFLGMPSESDWVFYGINGFDTGLMHNAIYHWLGAVLGVEHSRTRFVEVFRKVGSGPVTTNDYFGLYLAIEKPKVGKNRLNIAAIQDENTNAPSITGGYLAKIDRQGAGERAFTPPQIGSIRPTPAPIVYVDPPYSTTETDWRRLAQINYFQSYVLNFLTNLSSASYTNPVTGYSKYIDTDQWIDHLIANITPFNVDGYRLSGLFYKDRDGRLQQGPQWDCDRCLGTGGPPNNDNRPFNPRMWRVPTTGIGTDNGTDFFGLSTVGVSWFEPLFRDPNFWQKFIDRYQAVRTNEYSSNAIVAMVDGFHNQIREAQVRDQARWAPSGFEYPRSGVVSANGYTFDFGPATNLTRGVFQKEVDFQKKWLLDRLDFLDTNFLAMPRLSSGSAQVPSGATVTVTPAAKANTRLYYTLDGTDPRLPGGAISPTALTVASGPLTLTITSNVHLFVRCYNTSHANLTNYPVSPGVFNVGNPLINSYWSGPAAATYYTATPSLRITEVMFNPPPPPAGNTNDSDNFEYVELKNTGAQQLNLAGFRLRGGIDFLFDSLLLNPGQYCVVVKNPAAFASRYGVGVTVAGAFAGNLANDGDHVVLEGPLGEPIHDFTYGDKWYPLTDGVGFSLVVADENATGADLNLPASWRSSARDLGSPGVANPAPSQAPLVYVNEAITHTDPSPGDTIELWNTGTTNANIGDWYLTDDLNTPRKYRIPANTIIPGGGYAVFYQSNSFGVGANNFALSSRGDEVYLLSGDAAGNLTGWYSGFDFGAQYNGVSFGRHVISTGADHFVRQISNTVGAANSGPLVGPIVISEVVYHPPDIQKPFASMDNTADEFIELRNITAQPQPLYDPAYPTNTWKLRDAVDFVFPPATVLPAGGYALVVSFDPADTAALAAFRNRYPVADGTLFFGPYAGQLDNSSDSVELAAPDLPEPPPAVDAGFVPYVLIDKVRYVDTAPWPVAADGIGPSLQRINLAAYGNDPANWVAAGPNPGAPYVPGPSPVVLAQPANLVAFQRYPATFSVVVSGPGPISYQWRHNKTPIYGAYGSTFTIPYVQASDAGNYDVVVMNSGGAISSSNAVMTVLLPSTITVQPVPVYVAGNTNLADYGNTTNATAQFSVVAEGSLPLSYQWRFNGAPIPGATQPSLTVANVSLSNQGIYDVLVTDGIHPEQSVPAQLGVLLRPVIIVAPMAQTIPKGGTFGVSVQIRGSPPPFGFLWRDGSTPVFTEVSDGLTSVFTSVPQNTIRSSTWRIIITNAAEKTVGGNSPNATFNVSVVADFDQDGLPDAWEVANGYSTNDASNASLDLDGDGMTLLQEYTAGTDPNDPLSYLKVEPPDVAGAASVEFYAVSNRTYTVEFTDELGAGWQGLADFVALGTNRVERAVDPQSNPKRFYRLRTPARP